MDEGLTHDYQARRRAISERQATGFTSSLSSLNVPPPYDGEPTIDDRYTSLPLGRRATRLVEEGRQSPIQSERRSRDGLLASIIDLYTSTPETQSEDANYIYPLDAVSPLDNIVRPDSLFRRRTMSMMSTGTDGDAMMDDDDPRVTGYGRNDIDEKRDIKRTEANDYGVVDEKGEKDEKRALEANIRALIAKQTFILKLAKALLLYGAPSHRIESQLIATARVLAVPCQVIHFPGVALVSFQDKVAKTSQTHIIKATARIMLGKLHTVHMIYRGVVHSEFGVQEGIDRLVKLLKSRTIYSTPQRCAFAFCCAFLVCLSSFGGSFVDAAAAGSAGWLLAYLQLHAVKRSVMFGNIFEISTAIWVAFVARGLSSWKPDLFCYSAVSTAGVVLILPGFAVLSAALELASKNLISGSARLVWAVSYTLFLGFSLTAGSDMWFVLDSGARLRRELAAESLTTSFHINGTFEPDYLLNGTAMIDSLRDVFAGDGDMDGSWTFINQTSTVSRQYQYQIVGCYRDPNWQWWRQPLPFWSLFILVPLYSFFSSLWNLQPWKSKQLPVMVTISCFSFAARKGLQHFIGTRNEIVSAVGAFVIGVLGNMYARVFKGTAFTCMVTAVCFLVPSGLAAAGGLAKNYQGTDEDQYTSSVTIGVRMLTVAIGTTVGLLTSSLVVYAFGPKKRSALFAF